VPGYYRIEIDLDGAGDELDRLIAGPAPALPLFESALMTGFAKSLFQAHVITGKLRGSGHLSSSFDGATWEGQIGFARYPGIFELARGNRPSRHHPDGRHYFFDGAGPDFERAVREGAWWWVTDGRGGSAPSEGLTWKSGGDDG
jgi:hypothetical protein